MFSYLRQKIQNFLIKMTRNPTIESSSYDFDHKFDNFDKFDNFPKGYYNSFSKFDDYKNILTDNNTTKGIYL